MDTVTKVATQKAPQAVGPYSQALKVPVTGHLIFVSGQLPLNPATGKLVEGSIEDATRQVLDNIEAILLAANSSLSHVVRVDIFVKDLGDFQRINREYERRFTQPNLPARQTVQVARLPMDAPIEISCIAIEANSTVASQTFDK